MGCSSGPDVVEDGLMLCLDAASKRSYSGSGTTWNDLVGANDGTLNNMENDDFSNDNGGSLAFDGSDEDIQTGKLPSDFTGQNNSVTLSCFFRADLLQQGGLIATNGSSRFYLETFNRSGQMVAHWGFGAAQNYPQTQALISSNRWYNYTATYDGSVAKGYLDGIETDSQVIGSQTFSGSVYIASFGNRLWFNGNISSVSIYNRALTADEIRRNYLSTKERYQ
jgi:hypothetical protein